MKRLRIVAATVLLCAPVAAFGQDDTKTPESILIKVLREELDYSMKNLAMPDGAKPYFVSYAVADEQELSLGAELGALSRESTDHTRLLDVDVRVGDYTLLLKENHMIKDHLPGEHDFELIGMHGGLTADELYVPLVYAVA